jgi:hypothetical protein
VRGYDFQSPNGVAFPAAGGSLKIASLPYRGFMLFEIG